MDPELVDRIYECSVVPELWPDVLEEVRRIAGCSSGTLFITKGDVQFWTASPDARKPAEKFVKEGWFWRGQIFARLFAARHAGFLTELDHFTPDELDREPIYTSFWRPHGVGSAAGMVIPIPTGENVSFILTRWADRGPVDRTSILKLDELRPHLARSVLISARLQLERARIASETLGALGLPALVLNEQGKALACNSLADVLGSYVQWRAFDRISLKDKAADRLLQDALVAPIKDPVI